MNPLELLLWAGALLAVLFVGTAVMAGLIDAVREWRGQGYWPGAEHDPKVRATCRIMHPRQPCEPGRNHPAGLS